MLKKNAPVLLVLIAALALSSCHPKGHHGRGGEKSGLFKAMHLAYREFHSLEIDHGEYRLVKVENRYLKAADLWTVTFKLKALIPDDPTIDLVGAGGEIFVNVDLSTDTCTVTYGE